MSESALSESIGLTGDEHVRRYRETDGEVGHSWREGSTVLLLTTTGRRSGERRTHALIYGVDGESYVLVASRGGAPTHPKWYLNLDADPDVEIQVLGDVLPARARTATGAERERLWRTMTAIWPPYDSYQARTEREIPVVVVEPVR